jgi:hypothetical protein
MLKAGSTPVNGDWSRLVVPQAIVPAPEKEMQLPVFQLQQLAKVHALNSFLYFRSCLISAMTSKKIRAKTFNAFRGCLLATSNSPRRLLVRPVSELAILGPELSSYVHRLNEALP